MLSVKRNSVLDDFGLHSAQFPFRGTIFTNLLVYLYQLSTLREIGLLLLEVGPPRFYKQIV